MPPIDRSIGRNVWIEFNSQPGVVQGGLIAADNLTQREFLNMLNIAFNADGGFQARLMGSELPPITVTDQPLVHGRYVLIPRLPERQMRTSDNCFYHRTLSLSSLSTVSREDSFADQVRHRDRCCVITGRQVPAVNIEHNVWVTFHAAHIFPLALERIFTEHGFAQLITYPYSSINSPQNGILLKTDIHELWDSYHISVNPDNGYQIQSFDPLAHDFHGSVLQEVCRRQGDELAVVDHLLRWHYVLCNMRGAGEACLEFDFPPGTDMIGTILAGPRPAEQMEAEMFNRLYH